jgi:hypothetical protein
MGAGLLVLAPGAIQAQLEKVSISGTMYEQGAQTDNGATTTTKPPAKVTITTEGLLKQLIADEFAEGNLSTGVVPKDAVLSFNGAGFEIDTNNNTYVNVSDIMKWNVTGQNDITAGSFLDVNGQGTPPFTQANYYVVTITYNDSSSTGALQFTVTGLATVSQSATNPNSETGKFTQAGSISFVDGAGEGAIVPDSGPESGQSVPFVMAGVTITGSGKMADNDGNGSNTDRRK